VPPLEGKALELYLETIHLLMNVYKKLIEVLDRPIRVQYGRSFKSRS